MRFGPHFVHAVPTAAGVLQEDEDEPRGSCTWTVFDRQLVEKVLEEHQLPKTLADLISEERRSYIKDVMEELPKR